MQKPIMINDAIVIVSGLPRSGTSLMMNMLYAAGLTLYVDNLRKSDINNPKGYFEHEYVKKLRINNSWLNDAKNNVVKIVSPLLEYLAPEPHYKIIFMERSLYEIRQSQVKMKANIKKVDVTESIIDMNVINAFQKHLQQVKSYMESCEHIEVLYIAYTDILNNPEIQCALIEEFLEVRLDKSSMAQVVEPSLHRNVELKIFSEQK